MNEAGHTSFFSKGIGYPTADLWRIVFDNAPFPIWIKDVTDVFDRMETIRKQGVLDLESYFRDNPEEALTLVSLIRVVDVNAAALHLCGARDKGELLHDVTRIFDEESFDAFRRGIVALWEGNREIELHGPTKTLGSPIVHNTMRWSVAEGPARERSLLVASIFVTTEGNLAEKSLCGSGVECRSLFEQSNDGILLHNWDGAIEEANDAALRLLGYPRKELLGREVKDLHDPEDLNVLTAAIQDLADTGSARFAIRLRRQNGNLLSVEVNSSVVDARGEKRIRSIFREMTDRRQRNEETVRRRNLESLGAFAGGIAHDFNNLLTTIFGYLELIKIYETPSGRFHDWMINMERAAIQAQHLTRKLIAFSDTGELRMEPGPVQGLIRDSANFVFSGTGIRCLMDFPDDLLDTVHDRWQMGQVFHNLFMNALEASPAGGTVRVAAENVALPQDNDFALNAGDYVRVTVEDEGWGIPREALPRVFDPYFSTKDASGEQGRGLGLAVCYSIMKRHRGHIAVTSEEGSGAVLSVFIPVGTIEKTTPTVEDAPTVGEGRVLLMEAGESVSQVTGAMLRYLGYEVEFSRDGREAVSLYETARAGGNPFDIVILDLTVHEGMGALETIKLLKEVDPDVRAVVSSGYAASPVVADFLRYGFMGALVKPYQLRQLGRLVHAVLNEKT